MNLIETIILAIIQGITEWLPISSSGHLVLAQQYLGLKASVFFDVVLHVGTLIVVLVQFWKDITKILKAFFRLDFKTNEGKLALYVIAGSVPTAVIGFLFRNAIKNLFSNLYAVGLAFLGTGVLLYLSKLQKTKNKSLNSVDALLIGTAQGVALVPGVSRSGATIATGLLLKVKKERVFQFSFLLYIPAVIGAMLAEGVDEWENLLIGNIDVAMILLGLVVTIIVSFVFIRLLLRVLLKEKLYIFAYYCWALGFTVILAQLLRLTH
jgi:undecaprenyl-diphosphatase